ncbi:hypothetical protein [Catenuloplanes niger]|uniref:Uncharacterized protein n=1 Tax=Catenuloplanes niger TaxID=587534 RepID=A0AAE3ZVN8_9ACTN|nr:hypothetical protein [Catenuloplanes niger]
MTSPIDRAVSDSVRLRNHRLGGTGGAGASVDREFESVHGRRSTS